MKTSNIDYEKKYKEALEKIRSLHRDYNQISTLIDVKEELENIFPELAESEDEIIRKALMQNLKERFGTKGNMGEGLDMPRVLAWFERQGEQKPAWSEKDEEIWNKAKQIFPESLNMQSGYVTGYIDALKHFSLKKEWSEDDMKVIKEIIFLLKHHNSNETLTTVHSIEDMINWLNSLKDRVQPQPKQEWSEKDKKHLNRAINVLDASKTYTTSPDKYEGTINWLKSLRPQSHWKPTDEQIKVLNEVINFAADHGTMRWNDYIYNVLKSLREQLKNL